MQLLVGLSNSFVYNPPIMADEKIDFGKLCRELRDELGLTQKEMARKLGVALNLYQKYEAGKTVPGGTVAYTLAVMDMQRKFTEWSRSMMPKPSEPNDSDNN